MADEFTSNYGMLCPKESDTMSQQLTPAIPGLAQNLRDAWETLEKSANPDVIANPPLPQSGSYDIGDRVYLSHASYQSSFILIAKDAFWGWIWRPIQTGLAPWITVTSAVFQGPSGPDFQLHPTIPFQFTLDNKGNCYWRGAIRSVVSGIVTNSSLGIFAVLPSGLRNATSGMYTLTLDPATPQTDTGLLGYKGGRWYIQNDGYNSLRFHNTTNSQNIYFTGIEYVVSDRYYFTP